MHIVNINIGNLILGGQAKNLNREISNFVISISDRHQRKVKKLTMNQKTLKSLDKNGRLFHDHFVYLNTVYAPSLRTEQDYIQHIPITVCDDLSDGQVIMEW